MLMIIALLASLSQIVVHSAATGQHHAVTIQVDIVPSPDNVWVCTQFKSLTEKWTPRHCGPISTTQKTMSDLWPSMPIGGYDVTAELFRDHYDGLKQTVTEFDSTVLHVDVQ